MKMRWVLLPLAGLTIAAAVYGGAVIRPTLTAYTTGENWADHFVVAEMPEGVGLAKVDDMKEYLPSAPHILRVEVLGDLEMSAGEGQQRVKVQQVYAGEGLEVGQEFYLYHSAWWASFHSGNSLGRGQVNLLKVGKEYLVFLDRQVDTLNSPLPVYDCMEGTWRSKEEWVDFMAPIFCYEDIENIAAPITGEWGTGVAYAQVRDNEFFGATDTLIEAWEQMKEELLQMYPR